MDSSRNNICRLLVLGAFLTLVAADATLAPHAPVNPIQDYDIPKGQLPLEPYPPGIQAPIYGVPKIELPPPVPITTSYKNELVNPPPRPIEILTPYPAAVPVLKSEPYSAPIVPAPIYGPPNTIIQRALPVSFSYAYNIPSQPILKSYAPAPVYGPPRLDIPFIPAPVYGVPKIAPVIPAPVYGVPRFEIPAKPVLTSYAYNLPGVKPIQVQASPAALPAVKILQLPYAPHSQYGVPHH